MQNYMTAQEQLIRYDPRVASACARFTQGFFDYGIFHGIDVM